MQQLEEMQIHFDNRAETYNITHLEKISGGIESKRIIASFLPDDTKTIIDLGVGTGLELDEIFKRFPNVQVMGIDISEKMLKLLKETHPDKDIILHCNNYFNYSFYNYYYDVALSVQTLHHYSYETKIALYKKVYDCIKPNGVYLECDYMLSEQEYANAQEYEDFLLSEYKRLKAEQGITDDTIYHFDIPCTVNNQIKMLGESGFKHVKEIWRKKNTVIITAYK